MKLTLKQARKIGKTITVLWSWVYPECEWIAISENWDLNLWTEYDINDKPVKHLASIYPVSKSSGFDVTDYNIFYRVFEKTL